MTSRGHARRIAANVIALTAGDIVSRVMSFLVLAVVARELGAEPLGVLATGQVAAFLAPTIIDGGVSTVLVRAIADRRVTEEASLAQAWGLRSILAAIWSLGTAVIVLWIGIEEEVAQILIAFAVFAWSVALDPTVLFQARERLAVVVAVRGACVLAYGALGLASVLVAHNIVFVAAALSVTHLLGTIILIGLTGTTVARPRFRGAGSLLRESWRIGAALVCGAVLMNGAVLWLALERPAREVGEYNAALRIVVVAMAPSFFFGQAALARFTMASRALDGDSVRMLVGAARIVGAFVLPAIAIGIVFADSTISLAFGPGFERSGEVFAVLLLVLAPAYLIGLLQPMYVATGREETYLRVVLAATIATSAACAVLARLGPGGVAAVTTSGYFVVAALLVLRARAAGLSAVRAFVTRPLIVAVVGGLAALAIRAWGGAWPVAEVGLSLIAVAILSLVVGSVRRDDLNYLAGRRQWVSLDQGLLVDVDTSRDAPFPGPTPRSGRAADDRSDQGPEQLHRS